MFYIVNAYGQYWTDSAGRVIYIPTYDLAVSYGTLCCKIDFRVYRRSEVCTL